jgi:hypothetical protein
MSSDELIEIKTLRDEALKAASELSLALEEVFNKYRRESLLTFDEAVEDLPERVSRTLKLYVRGFGLAQLKGSETVLPVWVCTTCGRENLGSGCFSCHSKKVGLEQRVYRQAVEIKKLKDSLKEARRKLKEAQQGVLEDQV